MSVYKDEQRNSWFVSIRFRNWKGEKKQKVKRGFATKKEASAWEREFLQVQKADMGMLFQSFVEVYFEDRSSKLKERSIRNKEYMINAKVIPYFGKLPMNCIKPSNIMSW